DQDRAAAVLLGALKHNWKSAGLPMLGSPFLTADHDQCVKECQKALGDKSFWAAFEEGCRLDLDEASALALGDLDPSDDSFVGEGAPLPGRERRRGQTACVQWVPLGQ